MTHFFISYAKKDTRPLAMGLTQYLQSIPNVTAWMDTSLEVGDNWELEIQREIYRCDVFVVLYSPDINRHLQGEQPSYVLKEISYAHYTLNKKIIPIMAQATPAPMTLTMMQYIDFAKGMSLEELVLAVTKGAGIANGGKQWTTADILKPISPSMTPTSTSAIPPRQPAPINRFTGLNEGSKTGEVESALQRARTFLGTRNRDWTPYIAKLSDIVPNTPLPDLDMCLVPVGNFMMGEGNVAHRQFIEKPYWLAKYPTTNAQWAKGVQAKAVSEPRIPDALKWYQDQTMANCPVVGVNWFEGGKFVQWLGCQLPPENLWEYSARGVENLVYPWGNDFVTDNVVYAKNSGGRPNPVTSKPNGASWVGAMHMSGNVWEWCLTDRQISSENPEEKVGIRGGAHYANRENDFYAYERRSENGVNVTNGLSFRVFLPA